VFLDNQTNSIISLAKTRAKRWSNGAFPQNSVEAVTMFSSWNVKNRRHLISFLYHLAVWSIALFGIRVGEALSSHNLIFLSGSLLTFHLLTFKVIPVSRWLQEYLIPEAVCPGCGQAIELVGLYRCNCGYLSPRERHIFTPCPLCRKQFLWLICPVCETSILI
jgi:hypothetical protein